MLEQPSNKLSVIVEYESNGFSVYGRATPFGEQDSSNHDMIKIHARLSGMLKGVRVGDSRTFSGKGRLLSDQMFVIQKAHETALSILNSNPDSFPQHGEQTIVIENPNYFPEIK